MPEARLARTRAAYQGGIGEDFKHIAYGACECCWNIGKLIDGQYCESCVRLSSRVRQLADGARSMIDAWTNTVERR